MPGHGRSQNGVLPTPMLRVSFAYESSPPGIAVRRTASFGRCAAGPCSGAVPWIAGSSPAMTNEGPGDHVTVIVTIH
jgi:hypothetical protein